MKHLSPLKYVFLFVLLSITSYSQELFYLGIQDQPEPNMRIHNRSINDIIIEIFRTGLDLDVVEVRGSWMDTYKKLDQGEVYALGLVTKDSLEEGNILYSDQIFSENLYVVSSEKTLKSPYDLEGENIYTLKDNKLIKSYLEEFLRSSNISANIIEVDEIEPYSGEYYLDSEFTALPVKNKLFVRHLPPVCIGVSREYHYLIPKINDLLRTRYHQEISAYIKKLHLYYQQEAFRRLLTPDEILWLEGRHQIRTAYENDVSLSLYSEVSHDFIGILPVFAEKISDIIGVPIIYRHKKNYTWDKVLSLLEEEKIDFLAISPSKKRSNTLIFSDSIDTIPMYLANHTDSKNYSIGVIRNAKSDFLAKEFFPYSDIVYFNSASEMFEAFKVDRVGYIITPNPFNEIVCDRDHTNIKIKDICVNYAFSPDNTILQSIFNKAISVVGDHEKKSLLLRANQEHTKYLVGSIQQNYRYNKTLVMVSIFLLLLFVVLMHKMILNKKMSKLLREDQLTKLYNRFVFNKLCKETYGVRAILAVMDLDNFKKANDNYGHDVGDDILIEIGRILLATFGRKSSFRISGDEFYIFETGDFLTKLDSFMDLCRQSELLSRYGITTSLGYYLKKEDEDTKDAFKRADLAMYRSKKIPGFSCSQEIG